MIDDLNPRARALLDAARDGLGPDDAVIARVRTRVLAGGAAGAAGAAASSAGGGLATKLTIVGLLAVIAGGAWLVTRASVEPAAGAPVPELASPVEPSSTSRFEMAAPVVPPASTPPSRSSPRPALTGGALSLADEVALVDAAMAALRAGDHAGALAATERHAAKIGLRGQLAEEAAAVRVEALCRLDDERASAAWETFATRWPTSTQRPRIAAACKARP